MARGLFDRNSQARRGGAVEVQVRMQTVECRMDKNIAVVAGGERRSQADVTKPDSRNPRKGRRPGVQRACDERVHMVDFRRHGAPRSIVAVEKRTERLFHRGLKEEVGYGRKGGGSSRGNNALAGSRVPLPWD